MQLKISHSELSLGLFSQSVSPLGPVSWQDVSLQVCTDQAILADVQRGPRAEDKWMVQ